MSYKFSGQGSRVRHFLSSFFIMFLGLMTMTSCNKEEIMSRPDDTGDAEIQIGTGINLLTRATDSDFELGDSIGLYLVKWLEATTPGSLLALGNYADNEFFQLTALPDSWRCWQKYYYPADNSKLDFYAYYPYRYFAFDRGTTINLTVSTDQSEYRDYTGSDFMLAKKQGVQKSTDKVHLDFHHQMSQMVFVLKPGTGVASSDLTTAKVRVINAIIDATINLSPQPDSFPVAGTTRGNIVPYGSWKLQDGTLSGMKAIVVPQQINTSTYIEVRIGNRRFFFKPTTPINMYPGYSQEFTITINDSGIDIKTQVHPWNECPPVAGDATEELYGDWIVKMTTTQQFLWSSVGKTDDILVNWGDGTEEVNRFSHRYSDNFKNYDIVFYGKKDALLDLDCDSNQLIRLDVSHNVALTNLSCEGNHLTKLDVSKNVKLTNLNCGYNQLDSLNVSHNVLLTRLECRDNPFLDNTVAFKAFVNSLPDRSKKGKGLLDFNHEYSHDIDSICTSKNWEIR